MNGNHQQIFDFGNLQITVLLYYSLFPKDGSVQLAK